MAAAPEASEAKRASLREASERHSIFGTVATPEDESFKTDTIWVGNIANSERESDIAKLFVVCCMLPLYAETVPILPSCRPCHVKHHEQVNSNIACQSVKPRMR